MKIKLLYAIIILVFCISGCGNKSSIQEQDGVLPSEDNIVDKDTNIEISEYEILQMSNYMNRQRTVESGSWIYGTSPEENGNGVLSKIKKDGTELTKLSKCSSSYVNVIDGWIYYLAYDWSDGSVSIRKIRISGEDEKILVNSSTDGYQIQCMFIYDNKIYYAENYEHEDEQITGSLYCVDLNGNNSVLILDKATYYPYAVDDKIYYQDDNDDCTLHVCDIDGANDKVLINKGVFQYIIVGNHIYYQTTNSNLEFDENHSISNWDSLTRVIARANIDGSNEEIIVSSSDVNEMLMNSTTIYYTDENDEYRVYARDIETSSVDLVSQDTFVRNMALFESSIFYYDYADNFEYIDYMYIADLDGTYKNTLFMD